MLESLIDWLAASAASEWLQSTPWAIPALQSLHILSISAVTATSYLGNAPFRYKLLLILLAGANMVLFHFVTGRRPAEWSRGRPPPAARVAGGTSLLRWTGAVALGRWIAFA